MNISRTITGTSGDRENYEQFLKLFSTSPIPDNEKLYHLGLFIKRQPLSRILFLYELYKKILNIQGIIVEFGVRWGQDLTLFQSFRGMLEPFNYTRKIIGFDTFSGFPSVSSNDKVELTSEGDMGVSDNYESVLESIMEAHETASPLHHMKKFELIKGDASLTFKKYLEDHPESIIACAYFDFDIYEPTRNCLELLKDRLTKGSIIGFDEINHPDWPGETVALREVLGLSNYSIRRFPFMPTASYIEIA